MVKFKTTVFLLFFSFMLLSLLSLSFVAIKISNAKIEENLQESLLMYTNFGEKLYKTRLSELLDAGLILSKDDNFIDSLEQEDIEISINQINSIIEVKNLDQGLVIDNSGKIILSSDIDAIGSVTYIDLVHSVIKNNLPLASIELIKEIDLGKSAVPIKRIPSIFQGNNNKNYEQNGLALISAIPIKNEFGLKYVIVLIDILNLDYKLLDDFKEITNLEASLFLRDMRISTTSITVNGNRFIGTLMPEKVYNNTIIKEEIFLGKSWVINDWKRVVYKPIKNHKSDVIGALEVSSDDSKYMQIDFLFIKRNLSQMIIVATVFLIVFSLIVTYFISKRLTKPIHELIESATKVSEGDFEQGVNINSYEELNKLAHTFNVMIRYIRKQLVKKEREIIGEYKKKKK